ncbi:hypothetical protein LINPERPRIM_LOCUS17518 [Linum perenne]
MNSSDLQLTSRKLVGLLIQGPRNPSATFQLVSRRE